MVKPKKMLLVAQIIIALLAGMVFSTGSAYAESGSITREQFFEVHNAVTGNILKEGVSAVSYAAAKGYIVGDGKGNLFPERPVTRQEIAVYFARYCGLEESFSPAISDWADLASWSYGYVSTVVNNGIMELFPDGSFRPLDNVTEDQAVAICEKMYEKTRTVIPGALKLGDKVAIVAPANRAVEDRLRLAEEFLTGKGFEVVIADNITYETPYGIGDGSEQIRADAFNKLVNDPEIKAIFCLRGGYGSMHLLRNIDYEALRRNKPIFVGFSDITAMHTAIFQEAGLVTFHGPMLSSNYGQEEAFDLLFDMIMNPASEYELKNADGTAFSVINEGTAEGVIVGGNMTLISSLMGTEYELDVKGKVLSVEELDEAPYRLHRYLWQLNLAGKLDDVAAIVIGDILPDQEYEDPELSLKVILEALKGVNVPIIYNVHAGHAENPLTIPIGAKVRISGNTITVIQETVN